MKDLDTISYHGTASKVVSVLCQKTQSTNPLFFHVMIAYYFSKVASMMRASIKTKDRGNIPVNMYALNLATSGQGKGHSTNIVEESIIHLFREQFLEVTFPKVSEKSLRKLAVKRSAKKNTDPDEEYERVSKEFDNLGQLAFSFDSGTTAAVKQMRHKLLMATAGSMNMEIDEIGSNLMGNVDVLTTFLELYDIGKVKQKLTKNTNENIRSEEIDGKTPTNMMLFGTPAKLFNGGKVEEELLAFFETGYARRCFFGYSKTPTKDTTLTPSEIYDMLTDSKADTFLQELSVKLGELADEANFNKNILMSRDVSILLIEYKLICEKIANEMSDHEEIRKAEIAHRYFKVMKLAGTYAFIDGSHEVTEDHIYNAIKLAEASGEAFRQMLARDRNYVKLANYIASIDREVTHVDLVEDLPFYKGSENQKREMMTLAIAYGYKNNIIIKKLYNDGIEFLKGESLEETDLTKMIISHSAKMGTGYCNELANFDKLDKLMNIPNYNWVAHQLLDGARNESAVIPGFNMVVLDIDGGVQMDTVKLLLKDYKYMLYTTKRHTATKHRFRLIMPISHKLKMDKLDYTEFMHNIYEWLPFPVDTSAVDRSRKWLCHNAHNEINDGKLLNALLFIPKTAKNEERKKFIGTQQGLSNMERWFVNNTGTGNRSNQLVKYALMLVDTGMDLETTKNNVLALNSKLPDKMDEAEILSTILITAGKAINKRDT